MKKMKIIKESLYSIYPERFCDTFFKSHTSSNIRIDLRKLAKGQSLRGFFEKNKKFVLNAMKIYRLLEEPPSDPWSFNLTGNKRDKEKNETISLIIEKSWDFFKHGVIDKLYTHEELFNISITDLKKSYLHYLDRYESLDSIDIRNKCYELSPKLQLCDVSWQILNKEELNWLFQRMEKAYARMTEIKNDGGWKDGREINKDEFYDEGLYQNGEV